MDPKEYTSYRLRELNGCLYEFCCARTALKHHALMPWAEEHLEFLVHLYLVSRLTG